MARTVTVGNVEYFADPDYPSSDIDNACDFYGHPRVERTSSTSLDFNSGERKTRSLYDTYGIAGGFFG